MCINDEELRDINKRILRTCKNQEAVRGLWDICKSISARGVTSEEIGRILAVLYNAHIPVDRLGEHLQHYFALELQRGL